ncbi:MAG: sigma-70 family RNA polymerase sigma factor [Nannocystaceae bacterium]|nr:sigma-70 family RNA polymerase sigma factor [Myxococcales bacterium]
MDHPLAPKTASGWFLSLYRRHFAAVYRSVALLGVDPGDLEDAAQEVFMVAYRRQRDFSARRGSERAWLLGISRRIAWRFRRTRSRRLRKLTALASTTERVDAATQAERALDHQRARDRLERFLETLDRDKREAFVLGELEGLGRRELGELLGINPSTAYQRLQAARRSFHQAFPAGDVSATRPEPEAVARSEKRVWAAMVPLLGDRGAAATGATSAWASVWHASALGRYVIVFTAAVVSGAAGIAIHRHAGDDGEARVGRPQAVARVEPRAPAAPSDATSEPVARAPSPERDAAAPPQRRPARPSGPARSDTPVDTDALAREVETLHAARRELLAGRYAEALSRLSAPADTSGPLAHERALLRTIARCNLGDVAVDPDELARLSALALTPGLEAALAACRG